METREREIVTNDIPDDLILQYLNEGLRYSMEELHELAKLLRAEQPALIMYSNSRSLFCLANFSHKVCQLLLTNFNDLPLLAGNLSRLLDLGLLDQDYKKVYEWILRRG